MARKYIMSSARLKAQFDWLQKRNYKLRQEIILCNINTHFSESDVNVLKGLSAYNGYLDYPISEIRMYFVSESEEKASLLRVESTLGGIARVSLEEDIVNGYVPLFESNEEYSLFLGEAIPEKDMDDKPLYTFELMGSVPILESFLDSKEMLSGSTTLWGIFNKYDLLSNCEYFSKGIISCLNDKYHDEIVNSLKELGYLLIGKRKYGDTDVLIYSDASGKCYINLYETDSITLWYEDIFSDTEEILASLGLKEGSEDILPVEDFIEQSKYEIGAIPAFSVVHDTVPHMLFSWKYKAIMLNNNVKDALFYFSDVDLEDFLEGLHEDGFVFDSLGLVNVRSIMSSVTVCGFKGSSYNGSSSYIYIIFFFSQEDSRFMIKVHSSESRLSELKVEDYVVPLIDVNTDTFEDVTTLIRGFDFENFEEFDLV